MTRFDIDINTSGPIFDGRAKAALRAMIQDTETKVSELGARMIQTELDHVLQHQTGHYRSSIHAQHQFGDDTVTDGGIVYGPWLEGTGSRNETTRFKGYATFRRVFTRLESEAGAIAEKVLREHLRRMQ